MASNTSRLILMRSQSLSLRYLSTATATVTVSKEKERNNLYRKLSALGSGDSSNVTDALDEWVKEGKSVNRLDIIGCVTQFRKFKKYQHALQLYDWMDRSKNRLNNADRAIRMDLLAKTEGVTSAENYFNSLEETAKTTKTYGALLKCYCMESMVEKATEFFEKMRELNFTSNALNYNNLMHLYVKVGQPEKVSLLAQEMEQKNIPADLHTYNQLMNSYACLKDFEAVEGVLEKMRANGVKFDWFTYGNLATIYINAGFVDKANAALQNLEEMNNLRDREAFHTLITLYARTSDLLGVNRAWGSLKSAHPKISNTSYLIMLLALSKLNEVDALEKHFKEWESGCSTYDVRLVNVVLESYLNRNMTEEAKLLSESVLKSGVEPSLKTLDLFMNLYLKQNQMELALECLERSTSKANLGKNKWFPNEETVSKFLKHLEEVKDVESAEKFCMSMKKIGRLDYTIYNSLLLAYIAAGKVEPNMRQRIKEDGIEISSEIEKLLGKVSPN